MRAFLNRRERRGTQRKKRNFGLCVPLRSLRLSLGDMLGCAGKVVDQMRLAHDVKGPEELVEMIATQCEADLVIEVVRVLGQSGEIEKRGWNVVGRERVYQLVELHGEHTFLIFRLSRVPQTARSAALRPIGIVNSCAGHLAAAFGG